jgi:2-polyprenyl-3-methyl-5-hydroxy-6-metoxy-1,4-benzoquinol methylase
MSTIAGAEPAAPLRYETLERLNVPRPVERVGFIAGLCRGKRVLDIGCLDETALEKQDTDEWLHRRIAAVAREVIGIDSSDRLAAGELVTGPTSRIVKGDGTDPDPAVVNAATIDVIVAGEFIEHLENPLAFLRRMRELFPGRVLILSTPNGAAFANAILGAVGREAQHRDHLLTSTFKTLNTLCRRAECRSWQITPYRFYATEMLLRCSGLKHLAVTVVERFVRVVERLFPLRSFGYVVLIQL